MREKFFTWFPVVTGASERKLRRRERGTERVETERVRGEDEREIFYLISGGHRSQWEEVETERERDRESWDRESKRVETERVETERVSAFETETDETERVEFQLFRPREKSFIFWDPESRASAFETERVESERVEREIEFFFLVLSGGETFLSFFILSGTRL